MNEIWMIIEGIASLLVFACLLRVWGHKVQLLQRDMLMHFACAVTDWLVLPLRKVLPLKPRGIDFAALFAALIIGLVAILIQRSMLAAGLQSLLLLNPLSILLRALVFVARNALYLALGVIFIQAILSWVNPNAPVAPSLNLLSRPLLAPFRRIIPAIGGIDFSPIALILLINVLLSLLGRIPLL
jgi:YggT family protein